MGKASNRRAAKHKEHGIHLPAKPRLALDRSIRRACAEARVPERVRAVKEALRSPFFEKALNTALAKLHVKPTSLDQACDVLRAVLREDFGVDSTDVVIKLDLQRFVDDSGKTVERLGYGEIFAHPRLILPVVERFKREGRP